MKHLILMAALFSAAACAIPTAVDQDTRHEASLVTPVTFNGACTTRFPAVACDVQFYGDKDLGTASVYTQNVLTWSMTSAVNDGKTTAAFKVKVRYRDSWGRTGPWSQTFRWTYDPATQVTTPLAPSGSILPPTCYGTICIPAPTAAQVSYTPAP